MKKIHQKEQEKATNLKKEHDELRGAIDTIISLYTINKQVKDPALLREVMDVFKHIDFLKKSCPNNQTFQQYLEGVVPSFNYEIIRGGKAVFHFKDKGDKFYIILKGQVAVYTPRSEESLEDMIKYLSLKKFEYGKKQDVTETIYKQIWHRKPHQEVEEDLFLLNADKNKVDLYFDDEFRCLFERIRLLDELHSFGEIALYQDVLRSATIIAMCDLHVLTLSKSDFKVNQYFYEFYLKNISERPQQQLYEKANFFTQILPQVSSHTLNNVMHHFTEIEYQKNQYIWFENTKADFCLVVKSGRVCFSRTIKNQNDKLIDSQQEILFGILESGNFIGEDDLIKDKIRKYNCKVIEENLKAYKLTQDGFNHIRKNFSEISYTIYERIKVKNEWFSIRETQIQSTIQVQSQNLNQIYFQNTKPSERISISDFYGPKTNSETIRSNQIQEPISKTALVKYKIKIMQKDQKKSNEQNQQFVINDTQRNEQIKLKARLAKKLSSMEIKQEVSIPHQKSQPRDIILPITIRNSYTRLLMRQKTTLSFPKVTGDNDSLLSPTERKINKHSRTSSFIPPSPMKTYIDEQSQMSKKRMQSQSPVLDQIKCQKIIIFRRYDKTSYPDSIRDSVLNSFKC